MPSGSIGRFSQMQPRHAQSLHGLGFWPFRRQEAEAIGLIKQSIDADPSAARVHNNLANLLGEMGRFTEAGESYRKAVALQPDFWEAWFNLARASASRDRLTPPSNAAARQRRSTRVLRTLTIPRPASRSEGAVPDAETCFRRAIQADGNLGRGYQPGRFILRRSVRGNPRVGGDRACPRTAAARRRIDEAIAA